MRPHPLTTPTDHLTRSSRASGGITGGGHDLGEVSFIQTIYIILSLPSLPPSLFCSSRLSYSLLMKMSSPELVAMTTVSRQRLPVTMTMVCLKFPIEMTRSDPTLVTAGSLGRLGRIGSVMMVWSVHSHLPTSLLSHTHNLGSCAEKVRYV